MRSVKLFLLFFVIMGCQDSPAKKIVDSSEKEVTDTPCECGTIQSHRFSYVGINNPFHIVSNCPDSTDFIVQSDGAEISFFSERSFSLKSQYRGRIILKLIVEKDGETKILDEHRVSMLSLIHI